MVRRVVVTGLGTVNPVGNNVNEYWNGLLSGKNGIDKISRFDAEGFKVEIAAELKGFDPLNYMEKSDLRKNDLFTQYAIAAAAQAVSDSGIEGNVADERFGVYIGSGIGGINTTLTEAKKIEEGATRVSAFMVPMMIINMASGMVALRYKAMGPTLPMATACATSSHTIGEAFRAIKHGYADAIIAGGSEAPINKLCLAGFISCMALTTNPDISTACRPFDKERSGFVIGEGAGAIVLEEYEHAKARGAKIYAEIGGYGNTADAYHMTAPEPEGRGMVNAITLAVNEAGISVGGGTYINAHGTSTELNDKIETLAFKKAFGGAAYDAAISSTKSMTAHLLGAAGAIEAIAAVKALENGVVPPTIGYQTPDPECDLNYTPNNAEKRELDVAISTSLAFGGHNACLVFKKAE